jgi:hypothetical protein
MAKIYRVTGEQINVTPKRGKYFTLRELQHIVGGYIETCYLNDGTVMVLNEEGKLEGLPLNVRATEIFRKNFPCSLDRIVGDVLIVESKYIE